MTDSSIRLYRAITGIDDEIIDEANGVAGKKPSAARFLAAAAALCVISAGAVMLLSHNRPPVYPAEMQTPDVIEGQPAPIAADSTPAAPDYGAILYAELSLPAAQADPALTERFAGASAIDIDIFRESDLSACCGILEGRINNIYTKHYTYDYNYDKFGKTELFHGYSDSIVYELAVEKVWYGSEFAEGTTVLIEDQFYFPDMLFSLLKGRAYVIPISEYGNTVRVYSGNEEPSGDLSRDSVYSTVYPFHPQITKTEDGNYLVTTEWPSLTVEPCRTVVMEEDYDGSFKDEVRLVYPEDFAERLTGVIQAQLKAPAD